MIALLQGRQVDEGLEDRPGLTHRLPGVVPLAVGEVAPAHHGQDRAGAHVLQQAGALQVLHGLGGSSPAATRLSWRALVIS